MTSVSNKLLIGEGIVEAIRSISADSLEAAEDIAQKIMETNVEGLNFENQETKDLIVRPLALTILASEVALRNMFSESSLYGVHSSKTMTEQEKSFLFYKYATLNGINLVSSVPRLQYAELKAMMKGAYGNLRQMLASAGKDKRITSVYIADKNSKEMTRDNVPYLMLNTLKIDAMTHDELELSTATTGSYSREEVENFHKWKDSSRIKLGGCIDVIFVSEVIEETITIPVSDNRAILSSQYYIDIVPEGLEMEHAIEHTDAMFDGIVKTEASVYIQDDIETVTLKLRYYSDPIFNTSIGEEIEVSDILFKGAYPLLVDLKLYTKEDIDIELAKSTIRDYLALNNHQMELISPSEIHAVLKAKGITATVSSVNRAKIYLNNGISKNIDITFPLTMRDIPLNELIDKARISENTVAILLNDIITIKE